VAFEEESTLKRIEECAFGESGLKTLAIPSTVESIGDDCFLFCESLSEVTFEKEPRVERIGRSAFRHSSLKSMTIPASVKEIGSECFDCRFLKEVVFEGTNVELKGETFVSCHPKIIGDPCTLLAKHVDGWLPTESSGTDE
jgi:hypothetical protein